MIVSNIGVVNDFSSLYTTNAGSTPATIQVALNDDHKVSSFEYMDRVQKRDRRAVPGRAHVLPERLHGGRDPQHGHARAHRRAGQQLAISTLTYNIAQDLARRIRAAARRRPDLHPAGHELSRPSGWTSIACTPANWD